MKRYFIGIVLMTMSFNLFAKQTVVLAAEDSWPPYADINGNGISKTLIRTALQGSRFDVEFVTVPYARALEMTEHGQVVGCFNVTRQRDTQQRFLFGEQVLLVARASYFYPNNSSKDYASPADIPNNTSVALIIGYEYGEEYEKHRHRFNEHRVSKQSQIIALLQNQRVDMAIMFDEVAKYTLTTMNLTEDVIDKGELNHRSDIYVAFSRQHPLSVKLVKALDMGLQKLKATGENQWLK